MSFRPNSILMNRSQPIVPSHSHISQWIDYNNHIKKIDLIVVLAFQFLALLSFFHRIGKKKRNFSTLISGLRLRLKFYAFFCNGFWLVVIYTFPSVLVLWPTVCYSYLQPNQIGNDSCQNIIRLMKKPITVDVLNIVVHLKQILLTAANRPPTEFIALVNIYLANMLIT